MPAAEPVAARPRRPRATPSRSCSGAAARARCGARCPGAAVRRWRSRCSSRASRSGRRGRPRCWASSTTRTWSGCVEVVHQPRRGGVTRVALVLDLLEGGSLGALLAPAGGWARRGGHGVRPGRRGAGPRARPRRRPRRPVARATSSSPPRAARCSPTSGSARHHRGDGGRRGHPRLRRPDGGAGRRPGAGLRRLRGRRRGLPRAHRDRALERGHPRRHAGRGGARRPARPRRAGSRGPAGAARGHRPGAVGRPARPRVGRRLRPRPPARLPPGAGGAPTPGVPDACSATGAVRARSSPTSCPAAPAARAGRRWGRPAGGTGWRPAPGRSTGPRCCSRGRGRADDGASWSARAGRVAGPAARGRAAVPAAAAAATATAPDDAAPTAAGGGRPAPRPEAAARGGWRPSSPGSTGRRAEAFATASAELLDASGPPAARSGPPTRPTPGAGRGRGAAARVRAHGGRRRGGVPDGRPRGAAARRRLAGVRGGGGRRAPVRTGPARPVSPGRAWSWCGPRTGGGWRAPSAWAEQPGQLRPAGPSAGWPRGRCR